MLFSMFSVYVIYVCMFSVYVIIIYIYIYVCIYIYIKFSISYIFYNNYISCIFYNNYKVSIVKNMCFCEGVIGSNLKRVVYLHLHRFHQPNQYVSLKLGNSSKLEARYYGQFEILERIRSVAYMFPLLASMIIHNVFYVSLLKKYIPDASHVIDWNVILV